MMLAEIRHPFQPLQIFELLLERWGPQHWWPARTEFEVVIGAILTQNTNWSNVERAIANLSDLNALKPEAMSALCDGDLAEAIKPAGYYNVKTQRIRNFLDHLNRYYSGELHEFFKLETQEIRQQLLQINGIGPETADSILLYAAQRPVFVIDAYTRRLMIRHGWSYPSEKYYDISVKFTREMPRDLRVYNEFHALIVRLGKECCKPKPICEVCPLRRYL